MVDKKTPKAVRQQIRSGELRGQPTTGYSQGFCQANVLLLPTEHGDAFEQFCRRNPIALPLLHRSKNGDFTAGPLAHASDIRTDVPAYIKYVNGEASGLEDDLLKYDLLAFDTFYFGCSFSFEKALMDAGIPVRNIEQQKNVSMYRTNIPLTPLNPFGSNIIVSMRPIPREHLSACVTLTSAFPFAHGAPIHIGNPSFIGIKDLTKPDFGDAVVMKDGDVPVFWGCGVTVANVLQSARLPLAFTHAPGCMFITDAPVEASATVEPLIVKCVHEELNHFSVLSSKAHERLQKIEQLISADPGNRGIEALRIPDDFVLSCLALSEGSNIMLTTGFPCHDKDAVPYENDGPAGILTLAIMLLQLGKSVTIVGEQPLITLMETSFEQLNQFYGVPAQSLSFLTLAEMDEVKTLQFDVILACERVAPGDDGNYYTMKQRPLPKNQHLEPIEKLFLMKNPPWVSIGIGDGGNEVGMGKVKGLVKEKVNFGDVIASSISTDLLVTAGVSNWGAWGLVFGLFELTKCDAHQRYKGKGMMYAPNECVMEEVRKALPNVEKEQRLLKAVESLGMQDGICKLPMHVDGMPFEREHTRLLADLLAVVV